VTALRGALGFFSRLPIGTDERAWDAFRARPLVFPVAGALVGGLVALPLALPVPAPTAAFAFVAWLYLVTGIAHLDGLADVGDASVVHGDPDDRAAVMKDTAVGVGGALAVGLAVTGVGLAGLSLAELPLAALLSLAELPLAALGIVVAAEVGAKAGIGVLAGLGTARHDGLGARVTEGSGPLAAVGSVAIAAPAAAFTWPHPAAAAGLAAALVTAGGTLALARRLLGGVSGDVFGASNELARLAGLHAGVIAWLA